MGLLKTIFFILAIYYAFKFLARIFAPLLMKKMVDKMQQKAEEQFGKTPNNNVKEGETIIDKKPQQNQQGSTNVGEYVDFEEVD